MTAGLRRMRALGYLVVTVGLITILTTGSTATGLTGVGATAPASAGSQITLATTSEIDAFLKKERADLKMSGLAVVVLSKGSVVFGRTYGDAAPGGPAVTLDTPFVLGSTSKQFTGLAIQQLIATGKLSLDDTVGMLLQQLGGDVSAFAAVTVAQLLGHTSGIGLAAGGDVTDPAPGFTSLEAATRHLLQSTPSSRPGTKFEYSNGNYTMLGSIIERITGHSFEEALGTLVVKPLGLTSTTSDLASAQRKGLAVGHYTWFGAIDSTIPGPRWPMGAPSAYTTSTAADLTRLEKAELGQRSGIDPAVFAADHAPLATVDRFSKYASGWYQRRLWELHDRDENYDDPSLPLIYEHTGSTSREVSYLAFSPELGLGVVMVSNTGLGTDTARLGGFDNELLHTIVGTKASPPVVDPLIAAAPMIMVALPLLQLASLVALIAVSGRRRRSRLGGWIPRIAATLMTLVSVYFVFVVVPAQSNPPLLNRSWFASVPDLGVSVAVSSLLAAACLVVGAVEVIRRRRVIRSGSTSAP
jgi:CubicO group peptidase (beta-lactamase class C family)